VCSFETAAVERIEMNENLTDNIFLLCAQRYALTDRIVNAVDDVAHARQEGQAAAPPRPRVSLRMAELRSSHLSSKLQNDPMRHLRALEAACHAIASEERPGYDKDGTYSKRPAATAVSLLLLMLVSTNILTPRMRW
jgi:hypothetical protein